MILSSFSVSWTGTPASMKTSWEKKMRKNGANKDDELVTIEGFELSAVHVPGGLLASLVETGVLPAT